jgi:hypothetical protein
LWFLGETVGDEVSNLRESFCWETIRVKRTRQWHPTQDPLPVFEQVECLDKGQKVSRGNFAIHGSLKTQLLKHNDLGVCGGSFHPPDFARHHSLCLV